MIVCFEETGTVAVKTRRDCKLVYGMQRSEKIATAVVEQAHGSSSTRAISRDLDIPYSTVRRVLYYVLKFYRYAIRTNCIDARKLFALMFLVRTTEDNL